MAKIRRCQFKTYNEYLTAVFRDASKGAKRIVHLAFNSKKRRVKKKNWSRIGK